MIDEHKPTMELNNNNDNNNSNNNRAEWKLQLIIKINFTSVRHCQYARATYSVSKPAEIYG